MQVSGAQPDGQVQPFDVGSVQLAGIFRISPRLVPSPSRTGSSFPLNAYNSILPPLLDDLTVQTWSPEESSDDLPIELDAIGGDQWKSARFHAGKNILKERERVAITALANNGCGPKTRPKLDGGENPHRRMSMTTHQGANLVGLQLSNRDFGNCLMVESTARSSGLFQPPIHGVPSNLLGSGNRGFIQTLDAQSSNFVEHNAPVLDPMIDGARVRTESFPTTSESKSTTFATAGWVESKTNYHFHRGFRAWQAIHVWTIETFHGG